MRTEVFFAWVRQVRRNFPSNAPRPMTDGEVALTAAILTLATVVDELEPPEPGGVTLEDAP